MTYVSAKEIAQVLYGEAVETDDDVWVVLFDRPDGRVVTLSETSVDEYFDRAAFDSRSCYSCISLS